MSPSHSNFDDFDLDRLNGLRARFAPQQTFSERLNQPTVIISIVILATTILYNSYGSRAVFDEVATSLVQTAWDGLIYAIPSPIIHRLDSWISPQKASSEQMLGDSLAGTHASKSAAMRRILGLDHGRGMMASVFRARTRALSITGNALGLKIDTEKPAGLGNRDNSCFQNSILQGLASLEKLPYYLSACLQNTDVRSDTDKAVTQTLRVLLSDLNDTTNNGRTLWTPNKLRFMSTWTQQDAQEYFSKILDDIDKGAAAALKASEVYTGFEAEGKEKASGSEKSEDSGYQSLRSIRSASEATKFRNPLEGLLAQRVACVQCGHTDGLSMIPFNCLTLSLGLRGQHDLYERLDAYTHVESIEGVECPKCTLLKARRLLTKLTDQMREKGIREDQMAEPLRRLAAAELALEEDHFDEKTLAEECKITGQSKVTTTKTKQIVVARPPQSLAIHVNRSVFNPATFEMVKNSAPVDFPMTLDLGPWCLGSAESTRRSNVSDTQGDEKDDVEQWLSNPKESMVAGDLKPSKLCGPIYQLRAVVTHYGRHENGHYICYRRIPRASGSKQSSAMSSADNEQDDVEDPQPKEALAEDAEVYDSSEDVEPEIDWWRLSDHNVSKVDEQTVSSLAPGVFMLFYDCVDPSMVLQDGTEVESAEFQSATASVNGNAEITPSEGASGHAGGDSGHTEAYGDNEIEPAVLTDCVQTGHGAEPTQQDSAVVAGKAASLNT